MTALLTLYGKPGCHLCDEARAAVAEAVRGLDVEVEEVDVSLDPGLSRRYGDRIPVGVLEGRELFELSAEPAALRARLKSPR